MESSVTTSCGSSVNSGEPTAKISDAKVVASMPTIFSSRAMTLRSIGVAVGEVRFSVSEISPAMSSPAVLRGISTPFCW